MTNLTQNLILAEYAVKYVETIMSKGPGAYNRPESVVHRLPAEMRSPPPPRPLHGPDLPPQQGLFGTIGRFLGDSAWVAAQKARTRDYQEWLAKRDDALRGKTAEIRKEREDQQAKLRITVDQGGDSARNAILCASLVERTGLGNCGEQSYVAFKYLVTKGAPGLAIMDWDSMLNSPKGADKLTGNHTFVVIGMDATAPDLTHGSLLAPPAWGENAVVCDPWYHEWFKVESVNDWQSRMKRILSETLGLPAGALDRAKANEGGTEQTKYYAQNLVKTWRFKRLAFLPHGNADLTRLACMIGNQLPTLHERRAPHFRGAAL